MAIYGIIHEKDIVIGAFKSTLFILDVKYVIFMSEIMVVVGTRPEIMKTASVIENLRREASLTLVWSGQHYDPNLYRIFFEQFKLPEPDYDLEAGSGTHSNQTSRIMVKLEEIAEKTKPKIILAEGDTNTVVAVALASAKLRIPFAHVESGMRSFDMTMPEEINRLVADRVAEYLFAPTETAMLNLLFEGISPGKVRLSGDTCVDAILKFRQKIDPKTLDNLSVKKRSYGLVTIHRSENTENRENLKNIVEALKQISVSLPLIFPMHPRTKEFMKLNGYSLDGGNVKVITPLGYLEFLSLLQESLLVITDSGGVQEEAMTLRVPCITARNNTEWPETIEFGGNILTGPITDKMTEAARHVMEHNEDIRRKADVRSNPLGDGRAGERISKLLLEKLRESASAPSVSSIDFSEAGYPKYMLIPGVAFANMSVNEVTKKWGIGVGLIYDDSGKPKPPYLDVVMQEEWSIIVRGPAKHIESVIQYSTNFNRCHMKLAKGSKANLKNR